MLSYLEGELGLSKEDVSKVVKKFPEVMNLNVDRRLKANIEHMQKVSSPELDLHSNFPSSNYCPEGAGKESLLAEINQTLIVQDQEHTGAESISNARSN